MTKKIKELEAADLFSFKPKGAIHMRTNTITATHLEYKSYEDGKIRVWLDMERKVYCQNHRWIFFATKHVKQID